MNATMTSAARFTLVVLACLACSSSLAAATMAAIGDAAERAVRNVLGDNPATTLSAERLDPRLRLAPCDRPLAARLNAPLGSNARRATVRVDCPGTQAWKLYVSVSIRRQIAVPIATRPIAAGSVLAAADFELVQRTAGDLPNNTVTTLNALVGRQLVQPVMVGEPVRSHQMRNPIVVKRGQFVTIESKKGPIIVKMGGIVQSAGSAGGIVSVRNQQSGRLIQARIVDANRVTALGTYY